jgi:hypothetical protein
MKLCAQAEFGVKKSVPDGTNAFLRIGYDNSSDAASLLHLPRDHSGAISGPDPSIACAVEQEAGRKNFMAATRNAVGRH